MAVSVTILVLLISLHLLAFVFAVGAERRRSEVTLSISHYSYSLSAIHLSNLVPLFQAKVVPDEYDDRTFCVYTTDASTVYGLAAFGLLLLSQAVLNGITRCFCCGKGLVSGCSTTTAVIFFILSW